MADIFNSDAAPSTTRALPFQATSWNAEARTFDMVLSAGAAVERVDARGSFDEVLSLAGAVLPDRVPLLDSHNRFELEGRLGEVTNLRLVAGQLVGTARLSKHSPMAQRIAAEIEDGDRFAVSIGYSVPVDKWAERTNPTTKRREKVATAFDLLEASLVAIPADPAATTRTHTMTPEDDISTQPVHAPRAGERYFRPGSICHRRASPRARAKGGWCNFPSGSYRRLHARGRTVETNSSKPEELGVPTRAQTEEYDAAQERGEVRRANNEKTTSSVEAVSAADIGLTHKDIHDARQIRDAGLFLRVLRVRLRGVFVIFCVAPAWADMWRIASSWFRRGSANESSMAAPGLTLRKCLSLFGNLVPLR